MPPRATGMLTRDREEVKEPKLRSCWYSPCQACLVGQRVLAWHLARSRPPFLDRLYVRRCQEEHGGNTLRLSQSEQLIPDASDPFHEPQGRAPSQGGGLMLGRLQAVKQETGQVVYTFLQMRPLPGLAGHQQGLKIASIATTERWRSPKALLQRGLECCLNFFPEQLILQIRSCCQPRQPNASRAITP